MTVSRLQAAAFAWSLSLLTLSASAQAPSPADKAFRDGLQAMTRKDYVVACEKFRQSDSLDTSRSARHELAKCELAQGKFRAAWQDVQSVIKASAPDDKQVLPAARETAAAIEKRAPHLTIRLSPEAPDDTVVSINGADVPRGELGKRIVVDAGETHVLARTSAGGEDKQTLSLTEGEARELKMAPWIESASATDKPVEMGNKPAADSKVEVSGSTKKTTGYVSIGVGAAGLLGAGFFGYRYATDKNDACVTPDATHTQAAFDGCHDDQSKRKTDGTIAALLGGLGAVGVGVGLFLVTTSSAADGTAPAQARTSIVPWVGSTHAGAAVSTSW